MELNVFIESLKVLNKYSLLYVEEDPQSRERFLKLFNRIFGHVYTTHDMVEGYELFKAHKPHIVIIPLEAPHVTGLAMTKKMKANHPFIKIIITSASEDQTQILKLFRRGIFDYIKKPLQLDEIAKVLQRCNQVIEDEENSIFIEHFNPEHYSVESDLMVLKENNVPVFANQKFLDFFNCESISAFNQHYKDDFLSLLRVHKNFLYGLDAFHTLKKNPNKLFHGKIADKNHENHHFIISLHPVFEQEEKVIVIFKDITELKLLELFDEDSSEHDKALLDHDNITNLLNLIYQNDSDIKVHNYYKGLNITHNAKICKAEEDTFTMQTSFLQLNAINKYNKFLISSEFFPADILCEGITNINEEDETVTFTQTSFMVASPSQRQSLRVKPSEDHTVSFTYNDEELHKDVIVGDLSISAIKLIVKALPAGLQEKTEMKFTLDIPDEKKPFSITAHAVLYKVRETTHHFEIILKYTLDETQKLTMQDYIVKRQMELIREFKALNFASF